MVDTKVATPREESDYYLIDISGSTFKTDKKTEEDQIKHHLSHHQYVMFGEQSRH